jgi:hypothetical protein
MILSRIMHAGRLINIPTMILSRITHAGRVANIPTMILSRITHAGRVANIPTMILSRITHAYECKCSRHDIAEKLLTTIVHPFLSSENGDFCF